MKDYKRYILWLDYFDSELKRREGRRVPLNSATRSPKIEELGEACRRLNLQPNAQPARYPMAPNRESGYVSVVKSKEKHSVLLSVAKELVVVRGLERRKLGANKQGQRKSSKKSTKV